MAAVASRYARALVEVVLEQKIDADDGPAAVELHCGSGARERRLAPSVGVAGDIGRAEARCAGRHRRVRWARSRPIRNFIAVLIDHRRIPMLDDIARQFEVELDAQLGFVEAEISSARAAFGGRETGVGIAGRAHDRQESARALRFRSLGCWAESWSASAARFMTARCAGNWRR